MKKCKEVMTKSLVCCLLDDTVTTTPVIENEQTEKREGNFATVREVG